MMGRLKYVLLILFVLCSVFPVGKVNAYTDTQKCVAAVNCNLLFIPPGPYTGMTTTNTDFYIYQVTTNPTQAQISESTPDDIDVWEVGTEGHYVIEYMDTDGILAVGNVDKSYCIRPDANTNVNEAQAMCFDVVSSIGAGGLTGQETRDAMKLAPTAGAPATDSVDDKLDDILAASGGGFISGTAEASSTTTTIVDSTNLTSAQANAYVGTVIEVDGETSIVKSFNPGTDTITLWETLSAEPDSKTYTMTRDSLDEIWTKIRKIRR